MRTVEAGSSSKDSTFPGTKLSQPNSKPSGNSRSSRSDDVKLNPTAKTLPDDPNRELSNDDSLQRTSSAVPYRPVPEPSVPFRSTPSRPTSETLLLISPSIPPNKPRSISPSPATINSLDD